VRIAGITSMTLMNARAGPMKITARDPLSMRMRAG
jgi:hypothetical protein